MASQLVGRKLRFALVTDLDHTLVRHRPRETHEDLLHFNRVWQTHFSRDGLLVYSTGRSPKKYRELRNVAPMLTPDALVCSVGTEIFWQQKSGSFQLDDEWEQQLDEGWNRALIQGVISSLDPNIFVLQEESEQRRHKISFNLRSEVDQDSKIEELKRLLKQKGVLAQVIFSGGEAVDILPVGAGKGQALAYILNYLKEQGCYPSAGVQVNGDSGNDIDLFKVAGVRSCIVSNALPELRQWVTDHSNEYDLFQASKPCAAGIVEAMEHSGMLAPETASPLVQHLLASMNHLASRDSFNGESFLLDSFELWNGTNKIHIGTDGQKLRDALDDGNSFSIFLDGLHQETLSSTEILISFHYCRIQKSEEETLRTSIPASLRIHKCEEGSVVRFIWRALHLARNDEEESNDGELL